MKSLYLKPSGRFEVTTGWMAMGRSIASTFPLGGFGRGQSFEVMDAEYVVSTGTAGPTKLDAKVAEEVAAFLRSWLPAEAKSVYRAMIAEDPENWARHPHFSGGLIVEHALRGNGLTERALGVPDLEALWPELLVRALTEDAHASR